MIAALIIVEVISFGRKGGRRERRREGWRERRKEGSKQASKQGVNFLFQCIQKQRANVLVKWYEVAKNLHTK